MVGRWICIRLPICSGHVDQVEGRATLEAEPPGPRRASQVVDRRRRFSNCRSSNARSTLNRVRPRLRIRRKGIAQAENYEKFKTAAEQATDVLEDTYSTASKGYASYGLKVINHARQYRGRFRPDERVDERKVGSRSGRTLERFPAQAVRYPVAQSKDLSEHAQKVATETVEPIKGSSAAINKAA